MRELKDIRVNHTDVVLTDENIQPDMPDMPQFPLIKATCRHCGAHLSFVDGVVTCLNACYLSVGAYRRFQARLMKP